jgi:hypothetical protein
MVQTTNLRYGNNRAHFERLRCAFEDNPCPGLSEFVFDDNKRYKLADDLSNCVR